METGNLRRLCQRITPEQIEHLRQLDTITKDNHERRVAIHWNRNTDFHLKLCEMGGNGYICDVIAAALSKILLVYFPIFPDSLEEECRIQQLLPQGNH
ncbi:MAG: FCD domain-containing protein [Enterocloster clostridioformis]